MGDEIATAGFRAEDFSLFARRLAEETEVARAMFADGCFSQGGFSLGFEIEAWIVDHNFFPAPINQRLLEALNNPLVVPELSRFNVELNSDPLALGDDALDRAEAALSRLWGECNAVAHGLGANMVMIGTLPTIRDEDLTLANISPLNRYYALNKEVVRQRRGRPLRVDIAGRDHLVCEHRDVMLEAATTSFQIHLQVPADLAARYYNASVAASGPLLAACGNSPLLFGKRLWEETRIPLFEQAVDVQGIRVGPRRVSMGTGYLQHSCLETFEENLRDHTALLPMSFDEGPEALRHLRLHNGTIWRWNRPLIGFDPDGAPHLRIEHRILPAGPTIADMIANTAMYLGLVRHLVDSGGNGAGGLCFADAVSNFYAAARDGLDAKLVWPGEGEITAERLLKERLLPAARSALPRFGLNRSSDRRLDFVEARARSGRTGAAWQREAFAAHGGNNLRLMADYCERQRAGAPVHEWDP
jgi:gamma-glutamyl:cysteine ligase YbdK (ATP-grasp superfamily)